MPPPAPPLKPAAAWSDEDVAACTYDMGDLAGPPLAGRALSLYRFLCEVGAGPAAASQPPVNWDPYTGAPAPRRAPSPPSPLPLPRAPHPTPPCRAAMGTDRRARAPNPWFR
jgi:hypothetical protein